MRAGLTSPVSGKPVVATAFGELLATSKGTRYAYSAVDFAYPAKKNVLSAMTGTARYYPALPNFGRALVVTGAHGAQTLYAGISKVKLALKDGRAHVVAGHAMALSSGPVLRFAYAPKGNVVAASARGNPCGAGNATASGTVSVMPANVAVYARFHQMTIDGVPVSPGPYPSGNPDVATPLTISTTGVTSASTLLPTVYEDSDTWSSYYVVLCGNAVFATGAHERYAGPFPYAESNSYVVDAVPSPLPQVVFFTDPGNNGAQLTEQLPQQTGQSAATACPAAPPPDFYVQYRVTFNEVGQTYWAYFWCSLPDSITLTSADTSVATVSPSPLQDYSSPQPDWPPPAQRADFTAKSAGSTQISVDDPNCPAPAPTGNGTPFAIVVNPTPSPAPLPTAIPN